MAKQSWNFTDFAGWFLKKLFDEKKTNVQLARKLSWAEFGVLAISIEKYIGFSEVAGKILDVLATPMKVH